MAKNVDIHNHNKQRKLNLHEQHCNTVLFKKRVINVGVRLNNKVPDQIKLRENFNWFKKDLKVFLFKHYFYCVDEFMSF
jgi:hypothetical protein